MKDTKGWRWPWSRIAWAKTIEHITPGGPRVIMSDASYGGAQDESGIDDKFAAALKTSGVVILGYSFTSGEVDSRSTWKSGGRPCTRSRLIRLMVLDIPSILENRCLVPCLYRSSPIRPPDWAALSACLTSMGQFAASLFP